MSQTRLVRLLCVLCCVALLLAPVTATGLTLTTPKRDVLYTADLDLSLSSVDPTGTVSILAGGHVFSPMAAAPGENLKWRALRLPLGKLSVVAAVKTPSGILYSPPVSLNVWQKPAAPTLVTPSGGYGSAKQSV